MSFLDTMTSKMSLLRTNTPGRWVDEHVVKPGRFGKTEIEMDGHPPMPLRGRIIHDSEASLQNLATFLRTNFPDDRELENAFRVLRKGGNSLSGNYDTSYVTFHDSTSQNDKSTLKQERTRNPNRGLIEANNYHIDICERDDPASSRRAFIEAAGHSRAGESRIDRHKMNIPADLRPAGQFLPIAEETLGASTSTKQALWGGKSQDHDTLLEKLYRPAMDSEQNQEFWGPYHTEGAKVGWVMEAGQNDDHYEFLFKSMPEEASTQEETSTSVSDGKKKAGPVDLSGLDVERFRVRGGAIGDGSKALLEKASAQQDPDFRKVSLVRGPRGMVAFSCNGLSVPRTSSVHGLSL